LFMPPPATHDSRLSLHDALPIFDSRRARGLTDSRTGTPTASGGSRWPFRYRTDGLVRGDEVAHLRIDIVAETAAVEHAVVADLRSEEHTSELQSRENLVCRLLLE